MTSQMIIVRLYGLLLKRRLDDVILFLGLHIVVYAL